MLRQILKQGIWIPKRLNTYHRRWLCTDNTDTKEVMRKLVGDSSKFSRETSTIQFSSNVVESTRKNVWSEETSGIPETGEAFAASPKSGSVTTQATEAVNTKSEISDYQKSNVSSVSSPSHLHSHTVEETDNGAGSAGISEIEEALTVSPNSGCVSKQTIKDNLGGLKCSRTLETSALPCNSTAKGDHNAKDGRLVVPQESIIGEDGVEPLNLAVNMSSEQQTSVDLAGPSELAINHEVHNRDGAALSDNPEVFSVLETKNVEVLESVEVVQEVTKGNMYDNFPLSMMSKDDVGLQPVSSVSETKEETIFTFDVNASDGQNLSLKNTKVSSASSCGSQLDPIKLPEDILASPQPPGIAASEAGAKFVSERKPRRQSVGRESAKKRNQMKQTTSTRRSWKGEKSSALINPPASGNVTPSVKDKSSESIECSNPKSGASPKSGSVTTQATEAVNTKSDISDYQKSNMGSVSSPSCLHSTAEETDAGISETGEALAVSPNSRCVSKQTIKDADTKQGSFNFPKDNVGSLTRLPRLCSSVNEAEIDVGINGKSEMGEGSDTNDAGKTVLTSGSLAEMPARNVSDKLELSGNNALKAHTAEIIVVEPFLSFEGCEGAIAMGQGSESTTTVLTDAAAVESTKKSESSNSAVSGSQICSKVDQEVIDNMHGASLGVFPNTACVETQAIEEADMKSEVPAYFNDSQRTATKDANQLTLEHISEKEQAIIDTTKYTAASGKFFELKNLVKQLESSEKRIWYNGFSNVIVYCVKNKMISEAHSMLRELEDKNIELNEILLEMFGIASELGDIKFSLDLYHTIEDHMEIYTRRKILDFLQSAAAFEKDIKASEFLWKNYKKHGLPYNGFTTLKKLHTLYATGAVAEAQLLEKNFQLYSEDEVKHMPMILKSLRAI